MTEETVTVLKHTSYSLKFVVPEEVKQVIEKCKLDCTFEDQPIESFEIEKSSANTADSKDVLVHKDFNIVETENSGVYTLAVEYKKQQYIHKIVLDVGEFFSIKKSKRFFIFKSKHILFQNR